MIAEKIGNLLGLAVAKDGDIESRPMGQSGTDVILRGEAFKKFPYYVECCNAEKWPVQSKIQQAKANAAGTKNWLLFFKKNRGDTVVILDADLFFIMMEDFYENLRRLPLA